MADAIALDGLERATKAIRVATQDGSDIHARSEMLMCALEGGLGFQKGLGELGLTEDDVTPLAAEAFKDHSTPPPPKTQPRPIAWRCTKCHSRGYNRFTTADHLT